MGSNLARCLSKRSVELGYYNRTRTKAEALARELGGTVYSSPRELLEKSNLVVVFLATDEALREVVLEVVRGGVLSGKVFINASTVTPMASLEALEALSTIGVHYVESPVYGSADEARDCKLISIVACEERVFEEYKNVVELYSAKVFYVGKPPKASVLKLALNNIGLALPAILGESLMLLEAWGVDLESFRKISGEIWFGQVLERYWPRILSEKQPRFKVWMAGKDYWYVASSLKARGLPAAISDALSTAYYTAASGGYMDKDYPLVAKYYMEQGKRASGTSAQ